jgi:glucose-6-phosphate-specific signal transduction histidine kinase
LRLKPTLLLSNRILQVHRKRLPAYSRNQQSYSSLHGQMEERVAQLGGRLRVQSEPGRGTTVTAELPI